MTKGEKRAKLRLNIMSCLLRLSEIHGEIYRRVMRDENPGTRRPEEIKKEAELLPAAHLKTRGGVRWIATPACSPLPPWPT
jgi:hypothetical protein